MGILSIFALFFEISYDKKILWLFEKIIDTYFGQLITLSQHHSEKMNWSSLMGQKSLKMDASFPEFHKIRYYLLEWFYE